MKEHDLETFMQQQQMKHAQRAQFNHWVMEMRMTMASRILASTPMDDIKKNVETALRFADEILEQNGIALKKESK